MALTGCYGYSPPITSEPEPIILYTSEYVHQETTRDARVQAVDWQEAYAQKLFYYANTSGESGTKWQFILHDVNQNSIPELFLVLTCDEYIDHRAVYSIVDGDVIRLKTNVSIKIAEGGLYIPANGAPGIILVRYAGVVGHYNMLMLAGSTLSLITNGDMLVLADDPYRINAHPVSVDEFVYVFGSRDERVWLTLHEITEANISNIIFGW